MNTVVESRLVRDVFNCLSNSNLRNLEIEVSSYDGENRPDHADRPIYLRSLNAKESSARRYDILWRPLRHSLKSIESITSLTVVGFPSVEMEEAIFKLSIRMEER
jgi:hypothetical protein